MSDSILTFDPARHIYSVDGRELPSVTKVLAIAGLVDSRWYTPDACLRGQYVAQATEMYDQGELDESTLDPALVPYVDAWKKFLAESKAEVVQIEYAVHNLTYGYAGTLDRWVLLNGKDTIIDIKTGAKAAWHPVQTSAYSGCLKTHFNRGALYLRPNGSYKWEPHNEPNDRSVWMAALVIAQWKQGKGVK